MAKLVSYGNDIGYTILPYRLDTPLKMALLAHPSDHVLGYITYNQETGKRKFTYTESGSRIQSNTHWSLNIMNEFPYCEQDGPWIVYSCSPEQTIYEFGKIIPNESIHIYNWDTWSVVCKNANVAVVTSWEIF